MCPPSLNKVDYYYYYYYYTIIIIIIIIILARVRLRQTNKHHLFKLFFMEKTNAHKA